VAAEKEDVDESEDGADGDYNPFAWAADDAGWFFNLGLFFDVRDIRPYGWGRCFDGGRGKPLPYGVDGSFVLYFKCDTFNKIGDEGDGKGDVDNVGEIEEDAIELFKMDFAVYNARKSVEGFEIVF